MSRSGYSDDIDDQLAAGRWMGAVRSAMTGKRGMAFLNEMLVALDALLEKRLIKESLAQPKNPIGTLPSELAKEPEPKYEFCAIGAVGAKRKLDMSKIDPEDPPQVAGAFNIAEPMACEIVYINDERGPHDETPEAEFIRVREWLVGQIKRGEKAQARRADMAIGRRMLKEMNS